MVSAVVGRCVRARRPYRGDVSDARWALIEPVFTAWRAGGTGPGTAARVRELREIVNAILYVNRTGIPWETCRTPSRRARPSMTTTRSGKPTAPPGRSTTCYATSPGRPTAAALSRPRP
ncbi:transposase [Streptomyces sp. NPDC014676]|uniref:transposase n=1 Tax=Streptomyces sp. NPDC014676 TaxID=3364879 RepID=UPI0036FB1222